MPGTAHGIREPNPATRFHLWVYNSRPDVNAIVHTHPPAASALAAAECPLVVAHMDATPLFEDLVFLPEWPGLPTADKEGEIIATALGPHHAMLLAHHGLLTAGRSVQEAAFLAVFMERMAQLQINASTVGGVQAINPAEARRARDFLRTDRIMNITFDAWTRRAKRLRQGHPR
jgi:L-fuculose-phosphate aldolase